jgi:hypothetical protein
MHELGILVLDQLREAITPKRPTDAITTPAAEIVEKAEPPVVAQLMIEIRSDGSHTIARGALNDLRVGRSAQLHAAGATPRELVKSLASSLLTQLLR